HVRHPKGCDVRHLPSRIPVGEVSVDLEAVGGTGHRPAGTGTVRRAAHGRLTHSCPRSDTPAGGGVGSSLRQRSTTTERLTTSIDESGARLSGSTTTAAVSISMCQPEP